MRKSTSAALITALTATCFSLTAPLVHTTARADGCPNSRTFAVGGNGDPASAHVPGAPADAVRIHYPASIAPVGGMTPGDVSVSQGERNLDHAVRTFRAACPDAHVTVIGYSEGALIAGNDRDKWAHEPAMRANTNVVLVSDPRAPRGAMSNLPNGLVPGLTLRPARPTHSPIPTSSICRTSDGICNLGDPVRDPGHAISATAGYLTGEHAYTAREVNPTPGNHVVAAHPVIPPAPAAAPAPKYVPTPIKAYLPPQIRRFVPPQIADYVPPPLPHL